MTNTQIAIITIIAIIIILIILNIINKLIESTVKGPVNINFKGYCDKKDKIIIGFIKLKDKKKVKINGKLKCWYGNKDSFNPKRSIIYNVNFTKSKDGSDLVKSMSWGEYTLENRLETDLDLKNNKVQLELKNQLNSKLYFEFSGKITGTWQSTEIKKLKGSGEVKKKKSPKGSSQDSSKNPPESTTIKESPEKSPEKSPKGSSSPSQLNFKGSLIGSKNSNKIVQIGLFKTLIDTPIKFNGTLTLWTDNNKAEFKTGYNIEEIDGSISEGGYYNEVSNNFKFSPDIMYKTDFNTNYLTLQLEMFSNGEKINFKFEGEIGGTWEDLDIHILKGHGEVNNLK